MTLLVALAAALAPALPVSMVSARELVKVRDYWLLATLALGAVALAWSGEVWLACMALWFLCRWRGPELLPSLVTWTAIGATWLLLRGLPSWAWTYLPWAWLTIAFGHTVWCAYMAGWVPSPYARRALFGLWRTKATQGSPAITALYLALVSPFCPWWGWPILAVGLYLTWSWLAFIGVAVGLGVLYPAYALWIAAALITVLAVWAGSWAAGVKLFEWTPRGDSFDSVLSRLIVWVLLVKAWWSGPRWLGRGPYSVDQDLRRWMARAPIETPTGEASVELLQHLYEYGLLGVVGVVALGIRCWGGAHAGDPWTAALAAGAVMSWGHYAITRQPAVGLTFLAIAAGVLR